MELGHFNNTYQAKHRLIIPIYIGGEKKTDNHEGGPPKFVKTPCKFQNTRTTPSGQKKPKEKIEERERKKRR